MRIEFNERKTLVIFGVLLAVALLINFKFVRHEHQEPTQSQPVAAPPQPTVDSQTVLPVAQKSEEEQQQTLQKVASDSRQTAGKTDWPKGYTPTQVHNVPSDLTISPDSDGKYHWIQTVHPGDDIVIRIDVGWNFGFNPDAGPDVLDVVFQDHNGNYFPAYGINSESVALRFRVKPSAHRDVELQCGVSKRPKSAFE